MAGVNKAILIGRLGKDPNVRRTASGTPVATFSLATSETYKDKNGQKQERTDWHNIVAWNASADFAAKWLKKGKEVYVEGRISTRSYGEEGAKKWITEIVAEKIQFAGSGGDKDERGERGERGEESTNSDRQFDPPPQSANSSVEEDLPF